MSIKGSKQTAIMVQSDDLTLIRPHKIYILYLCINDSAEAPEYFWQWSKCPHKTWDNEFEKHRQKRRCRQILHVLAIIVRNKGLIWNVCWIHTNSSNPALLHSCILITVPLLFINPYIYIQYPYAGEHLGILTRAGNKPRALIMSHVRFKSSWFCGPQDGWCK